MKKSSRIIFIVLIVVLSGVLIFSGYKIISYYIRSTREQNYSEIIRNSYSVPVDEKEKVPKSVDFKALQKRNPDVVAWLYCEDTPIDYPVVKCKNDDEYIRSNLEHEYSFSGTLFIDSRNKPDFSDLNTIIYGHNMYNDGTMFAVLPDYKKEGFFEKHRFMYLLTPEKNYKLEAIAGGVRDGYSETYDIFEDLFSMQKVLKENIDDSVFDSGVTATSVKKVVTLSTCSYEYWTARFALTLSITEL